MFICEPDSAELSEKGCLISDIFLTLQPLNRTRMKCRLKAGVLIKSYYLSDLFIFHYGKNVEKKVFDRNVLV